jgi:hypothetical protein
MKKMSITLGMAVLLGGLTTITAQDAVVSYKGSALTENFDSMGAEGTTTPTGWFVGIGSAADNTAVTASKGDKAPSTSIAAFNYGVEGDKDRALGTEPTRTNRVMEVRIKNESGKPIEEFTVKYDGEQWRVGTAKTTTVLKLQFSTDGSTFTDMGDNFNFTGSKVPPPDSSALDGNATENRVADIGGSYKPTAPIADKATIYLRWNDVNDPSLDPGLAIDNFTFSAK